MEEVNNISSETILETKSKSILIWIIIGIFLVVLITGGIWWFVSGNSYNENLEANDNGLIDNQYGDYLCTKLLTKEKLREITGLNIFYFSVNGTNFILTDEPVVRSSNGTYCTYAEIKEDFQETDEYFIIPDGSITISQDTAKYDGLLGKLKSGELESLGGEFIRETEEVGSKGYLYKYKGSGAALFNFIDDDTNCYIELIYAKPNERVLTPPEEDIEDNIDKIILIAKEVNNNLDKTLFNC